MPETPERFGGHSGGETPGPIPNPEVKPSSADGTAQAGEQDAADTHPPTPPQRRRRFFSLEVCALPAIYC